MQSIRFILVSFGLAPAASMNHIHVEQWQQLIDYGKTIPCDTAGYEKPKNPRGGKNWKRIPRTNAVPRSLRGLEDF